MRCGHIAQMVVVHRGIEHKHKTSLCDLAPHRIDGEEYDVAAPDGYIDNRRSIRERPASIQHSADPKIFLIRKSQNDARIERFGIDVQFLFGASAMRSRRRRIPRATLRNVWIGQRTAAARAFARLATITTSEATASAGERNMKDGRLIEIDGHISVIAISDGTAGVFNGGIENCAASVQLRRGYNRNRISDACFGGENRTGHEGNKQAAVLDKLLEICKT